MGQDDHDGKIAIFKKLGVFDNVTFSVPERRCDIIIGNNFYSLPHGHDAVEKYLADKFPNDKKAIEKYFKMLRCYAKGHRRMPFEMGYWEFFFFPCTGFKGFIQPLI